MGTITAKIEVGESHWTDPEGIISTHTLFLSENSRPSWTLERIAKMDGSENRNETMGTWTWIPTIENMLEDGLLMIALYVLKDQNICNLAQQYFAQDINQSVELYNISVADREKLYHVSRSLTHKYKLIVTVFQNSTIHNQLTVFENYGMDLVVFTPKFMRLTNQFSSETHVIGSLGSI